VNILAGETHGIGGASKFFLIGEVTRLP